MRERRRWAVAVIVAVAVLATTWLGAGAAAVASAAEQKASSASEKALPVLAYYYIWFDPSSWERAKIDTPLDGTYSSDETTVMRRQIRLAKSAGIDGFLVSWKDTTTLRGRLAKLVGVARELDFKLGIVYQGLDFARRPLPLSKVTTDLKTLATRYRDEPVFDIFGDPVVIITGSGRFTRDELKQITSTSAQLTVLASAKSVEEYSGVADLFAGNAYYWGAANPEKEWYPERLNEIGAAVHQSGGIWIAPAAPGFDARLGGRSLHDPPRGWRDAAGTAGRCGGEQTGRRGPDQLERVLREHPGRTEYSTRTRRSG